MILLDTTYVENELGGIPLSKQKGEVQDIVTINGREATTVRGAQRILTERAAKLGVEREYSRDTVYRMLIDNRIEAVRTPSANYYFVDQLEQVPINPSIGRIKGHHNYPEETKQKALEMSRRGLTQRDIAEQLGIRFQTIGHWIRASKRVS